MLYWGIQFPKKTIIGLKENLVDQVVFYRGMYGVPSYIIWYIAPDRQVDWIKTADIFDFFIFDSLQKVKTRRSPAGEMPQPQYQDQMVVLNIIFDIEKRVFKLTAVSYFWYLLANTKELTAIEIGKQDNPVSGREVIKKLVDIANDGQEILAAVESGLAIDKIKYISINIDPEVSVLDKIADICLENAWEFYLGKGDVQGKRQNVVYIGNKLNIKEEYILPFEPEQGHVQTSETSLFTSITTAGVWCEPMLTYGKPARGRAIWTKFYLNNEGNEMTVMIQKIGFYTKDISGNDVYQGTLKFLSENEFIETLYGGLAREYGLQRLFRYPMRSYPILIGKMFGESTDKHKEEYSASTWSGDPTSYVKDLNKRSFKTEFTEKERPEHYLKNSKITTPFAGDGVGLLFPQVEGHKTLLAPDGERDIGLIGPGYFGPDEQVPVRASEKDFRFQLPNGWALIAKENGNTILQIGGADNQTELTEVQGGEVGIHLHNEPQKEIYLTVDNASAIEFVEGAGGGLVAVIQGTISLQADQGAIEIFSAQGEVTINSVSRTAYLKGPTVKIEGGLVEINGVKFLQGGIIDCTLLKTSGGVVPPNIV